MTRERLDERRQVGEILARVLADRGLPTCCEAGHYRASGSREPRPCASCSLVCTLREAPEGKP